MTASSVMLSFKVSPFLAEQLDLVAKETCRSKTDLLTEALKEVLSSRLDQKITIISDAEFSALMDLMERPASADLMARQETTVTVPYAWEETSK